MVKPNKAYISLKEASEISGYSPDYVGQLIRSGKLPGKQVFQQVVWMTTEEELRNYMSAKKGSDTNRWKGYANVMAGNLTQKLDVPQIAVILLYAVVALLIVLFFGLFFVFSTSVERSLDQKAIEKVQQQQQKTAS